MKIKSLKYDKNMYDHWYEFFDKQHIMSFGRFQTNNSGSITKIYDNIPVENDGIIFMEYEINGIKKILLEKENLVKDSETGNTEHFTLAQFSNQIKVV